MSTLRVDNITNEAGSGAPAILYDGSSSGLSASDIQAAIDETLANARNFYPPLLQIQHKLPGSTNSGTFSSGAWRDRPLNHIELNEIDGASIDFNTLIITLPPGYYEIDAYSSAFYVQNNTAIFRNTDTDEIMLSGDAGLSNANGGYNNTGSTIRSRLNLSSTTNMKLQHWASGTRNNDGFGYRNNAAIDNVDAIYADLRFWRLSDPK